MEDYRGTCPNPGHYHPVASENKEDIDDDYAMVDNEHREEEVCVGDIIVT